jgi:hypothetical protein
MTKLEEILNSFDLNEPSFDKSETVTNLIIPFANDLFIEYSLGDLPMIIYADNLEEGIAS